MGDPPGKYVRILHIQTYDTNEELGQPKGNSSIWDGWRLSEDAQDEAGQLDEETGSAAQLENQDRLEQCLEVCCGLVDSGYISECMKYFMYNCIVGHVSPSNRRYGKEGANQ